MSNFVIPIFYITIKLSEKGYVNQIWWERWNGTQTIYDCWSRNHVKISYCKFGRLQPPNLIGVLIRKLRYHFYIPRDLIRWQCDKLKTSYLNLQRATTISEQHIGKRGENPSFLVWFNHSKIVEDAALKLALVKGTHPHMKGDLWFCIIVIIEKSHITTFTKAFRLQISYKKEQNKTHLLFRFKDYMWMLYSEINLSLYVPRVYFFSP